MRGLILASAAAVATIATPAAAQRAGDDVSSYLCTFAGKCDAGTAAATEDGPVKAAPATKGFRLAAAQQAQPTVAAPATKGFRLSAPTQSTAPAPATKGFRLSGAPAAAPTASATRSARPVRAVAKRARTPRASYAAVRPAPAAGPRADLMLSFGYNSDQMTQAAEVKARGFAQALMMPELSGKRFLIEGHTDSRGDRDFNVDLSRRRAQSVADYLVAQGVDRSRVEVKGVGPDEPLPGRSPSAEANRRVEAVLIG